MKTMAMKYAGKCSKCGKKLLAGAMAGYEVEEIEGSDKKKWAFFCAGCANEIVGTKIAPETPKTSVPTIDLSTIADLIKAGIATSDETIPTDTTIKPPKPKTAVLPSREIILEALSLPDMTMPTYDDSDLKFWTNNAQWR